MQKNSHSAQITGTGLGSTGLDTLVSTVGLRCYRFFIELLN